MAWSFQEMDGKHPVFRCTGCRRMAIGGARDHHGLGDCPFCARPAPKRR